MSSHIRASHNVPAPASNATSRSGPHLLDLRPGQRKLIQMMRDIGHGRIEGLIFQNGDPVFTPPPREVCEIRLDVQGQTRGNTSFDDFALKHQVRNLINKLHQIRNGRVECIVVSDGLPIRMTIENDRTSSS